MIQMRRMLAGIAWNAVGLAGIARIVVNLGKPKPHFRTTQQPKPHSSFSANAYLIWGDLGKGYLTAALLSKPRPHLGTSQQTRSHFRRSQPQSHSGVPSKPEPHLGVPIEGRLTVGSSNSLCHDGCAFRAEYHVPTNALAR